MRLSQLGIGTSVVQRVFKQERHARGKSPIEEERPALESGAKSDGYFQRERQGSPLGDVPRRENADIDRIAHGEIASPFP
jgi:hypothetical protein